MGEPKDSYKASIGAHGINLEEEVVENEWRHQSRQKQIPFGNDRKKSNDNSS
jgi:hypothetical protein